MARVVVNFYGELKEKIGTDRIFIQGNTIKEILKKIKEKYPTLEEDIEYGRVILLVNGRNIETLKKEDTSLEDFDLVGVTLKDGGMIDFFPPDGGG